MSTALTPARKADLAYQAIRRAIIEQALGPGTKLPEDLIGAQFGVSRTLVRTVLGRLASEALIDIGNKRSATVSRPSLDEARGVFEVRRVLEAEAVRRVVERWQPAMGAELEGHVREEQGAMQRGEFAASIRLAGEFHVRLAGMTGNALLERYLSDVVTRCSLILAVYGRPHSPDCACNEHRSLTAALRERDADRAVRLMADHLDGIESRALIAELPREGHALGEVLSRYRNSLSPPATPPIPTTTRRRTA
jgi:DNA-binding GntR family transcriptional regulator